MSMHSLPTAFAEPYIQAVDASTFSNRGIELDVLRLDSIHPIISGNKWYKLKYHLKAAITLRSSRLISFGGPFSNHIVAMAYAAREAGMASIGIIRGERGSKLSHTLNAALEYGMHLQFLPRSEYRYRNDTNFLKELQKQYPGAFLIPEGGAGDAGQMGAAEILKHIPAGQYSHIFCAVGTGTTLAGILKASEAHQQITGVVVLKGMEEACIQLIQPHLNSNQANRIHFCHDYHFGGYARKNASLLNFMNLLFEQTGIPTDFVYTGKLFYGLYQLINKGYFVEPARILVIHSGGLQGNRSLPEGSLIF